ncbi:sensor histidine kinase [Haloarchaeobius sp. HRN-SO-5]|uniref:sensor histidine kinase n=1 Tax=Haloarchaeobius sp. HRN-SO-5 TaxID=3446118 RepID=UPI003EC13279
MTDPVRVLHVDGDPGFGALTAQALERACDRLDVVTATTAADALARLDAGDVDCVVSSVDVPGATGVELLETVRETHPDLPFVLFTDEAVAAAVSADVTDYVRKGTGGEQFERLARSVERAVGRRRDEEHQDDRCEERLEAFASVVSHDLRNLLDVATLRLELARDDCESEHLAAAADALARLDTRLEQMHSLAREGTAVVETGPVDLAAVARDSWAAVETRDAELRVETDRRILADAPRLGQVFENLFGNAVRHGRDDVRVAVGDLPDGFYVEDDGPGIPAANRDRVFEAGYSTAEEGTGFGLDIVRAYVTAHGWEIRLTEGREGGARFEITGVETE